MVSTSSIPGYFIYLQSKKSFSMTKTILFSLLMLAIALAQTSGVITYQNDFQLDLSAEVGDLPSGVVLPTNFSHEWELTFSGSAAVWNTKKQISYFSLKSGHTETLEQETAKPSYESMAFIDLQGRKKIDFLTVTKPSGQEAFFTETEIAHIPVKESAKTKTILGYTCHKGTATFNGEAWTLWITTDIDLNFSPILECMPAKGCVLEAEGPQEAFRATEVSLKPIPPATVLMSGGAKKVTQEELKAQKDSAIEAAAALQGKQ